jgi:subtilisin family serine protease
MIAPVYYQEGLGAETATSPLPDVVVIKFRPQQRSERQIIDKLEREMSLKHNQVMSNLLKPFHYFSLSPATTTSGGGGGIEETTASSGQGVSNAFEVVDSLSKNSNIEIVEYDWLTLDSYSSPQAFVIPNDTFWAEQQNMHGQWNMQRIDMPKAWAIEQGKPEVSIAIIDLGFDLEHPDLVFTPKSTHFNAVQALAGFSGGLPYDVDPCHPHGTFCAGIAAATLNNGEGIAGVAGLCSIMPLKCSCQELLRTTSIAACINWARWKDARVVSTSVSVGAGSKFLENAVENAWADGLVICSSAGNYIGDLDYYPPLRYPAKYANVIAVGATDEEDKRHRYGSPGDSSPDGECWGSRFGTGLNVMAPGVKCWTTDEQGADGFNNNGGPLHNSDYCMHYDKSGDAAGNYYSVMMGTSAAAPHVAGLAALLFSQYPTLTNHQVRNIIELTCDKVNPAIYPYTDYPHYPNGAWNEQMGYGRINAFKALDFADVLININSNISAPWPWDFSDIAIRPSDDNIFEPSDPNQSSEVKRGQSNILYIRVMNDGPNTARNVVVDSRIIPYVGLEFVSATDWMVTDTTHIRPTPLTSLPAQIPPGDSIIAKFEISSAQVEELYGWISSNLWQPCILASVTSDNDYAFMTASQVGGSGMVTHRNNLAQRNLSVVDYLAGGSFSFPFIASNLQSPEEMMELLIEKSKLPEDVELLLSIEEDGRALFPRVDFGAAARMTMTSKDYHTQSKKDKAENIEFLERTKIEMDLGGSGGVHTSEKGSRLDFQKPKVGGINIKGGKLILRGDKRLVKIVDSTTILRMEKQPYQIYPMALQMTVPKDAERNDTYVVRVLQRNQRGFIIGGATLLVRIK